MAGRPHKLFLSLTLGLCVLAWLAPAGDAKLTPSAHYSSATPPLGGVNIVGVGSEPLREADLAIARARTLHAMVVRTVVPWSALEPTGPNQIEPRALAFADRLMSDAAAAGIRVIMFVDSTPCWASSAPASLLADMRARRVEQGQRLASDATRRATRLSSPIWPSAMAHNWPRSRSGTSPTRPTSSTSPVPKSPSATRPSCGPPTQPSSRRTRTCPCSPARSSAQTGSSCARCMPPGSRATTTVWPCISTPSRSPRCARSTKCSWPTATPSHCGSTSSAGAAAGRDTGSNRNRRA